MSYISKNIGGKVRGMKFTIGALYHAIEAEEKNIDGVHEQLKSVGVTIYAGLMNNCTIKKETPDFTLEDCVAWAGEIETIKEVAEITEAFNKISASKEGSGDTQPV